MENLLLALARSLRLFRKNRADAFPKVIFYASILLLPLVGVEETATAGPLQPVIIGNDGFSTNQWQVNGSSSYEALAAGEGFEGTNDSFLYLNERFSSCSFFAWTQVGWASPFFTTSQVGFMIREDLSPDSRYVSIVMVPPEIPTGNGSGKAGEFRAYCRLEKGAKAIPWPVKILYDQKVQSLEGELFLARENETYTAWIKDSAKVLIKLAEMKVGVALPTELYAGIALASGQPGQVARVYCEYVRPTDIPLRSLDFTSNYSDPYLFLTWNEGLEGWPLLLEGTVALAGDAQWAPVADGTRISDCPIIVRVKTNPESTRFFRLRRTLFTGH